MRKSFGIRAKSIGVLAVALLMLSGCQTLQEDGRTRSDPKSPENMLSSYLLAQAKEDHRLRVDFSCSVGLGDVEQAIKALKHAERRSSRVNASDLKEKVRKPLELARNLLKEGQHDQYRVKLNESLESFILKANTITYVIMKGQPSYVGTTMPSHRDSLPGTQITVTGRGDVGVRIPIDVAGAIIGSKPILDYDLDLQAAASALVSMGNFANCFGTSTGEWVRDTTNSPASFMGLVQKLQRLPSFRQDTLHNYSYLSSAVDTANKQLCDPKDLLLSVQEVDTLFGGTFVIRLEEQLLAQNESTERGRYSGYEAGYYRQYRLASGITGDPISAVFIYSTTEAAERARQRADFSEGQGVLEMFDIDGLPHARGRTTRAPVGATMSIAINEGKVLAYVSTQYGLFWRDQLMEMARVLSRRIRSASRCL